MDRMTGYGPVEPGSSPGGSGEEINPKQLFVEYERKLHYNKANRNVEAYCKKGEYTYEKREEGFSGIDHGYGVSGRL